VSVIPPRTRAPQFELARRDGSRFAEQDLTGEGTVLVFYPFAFANVNKDTRRRKTPKSTHV
jgi:peroxiredoxin